MTPTIEYKVYPGDISNYKYITGEMTTLMLTLAILNGINVLIGILLLITGGMWYISLIIHFIIVAALFQMQKPVNEKARKKKAEEEASFYTKRLNDVLKKSNEIVSHILPFYEQAALKNINIAKTDFNDNAIAPFWDRIEEASNCFALYKEAIDQLTINGELYIKILYEKKHNFPSEFPISTDISISQSVLDEYKALIREAQRKFEFANIWEHRKTQQILIAGFKTLEQAINNMKEAIVAAISNLRHSIKSEFKQMKFIQQEHLESFESSQSLMNATLSEMNSKLYYIMYNKKPNASFLRPFFEN